MTRRETATSRAWGIIGGVTVLGCLAAYEIWLTVQGPWPPGWALVAVTLVTGLLLVGRFAAIFHERGVPEPSGDIYAALTGLLAPPLLVGAVLIVAHAS